MYRLFSVYISWDKVGLISVFSVSWVRWLRRRDDEGRRLAGTPPLTATSLIELSLSQPTSTTGEQETCIKSNRRQGFQYKVRLHSSSTIALWRLQSRLILLKSGIVVEELLGTCPTREEKNECRKYRGFIPA